MKFRFFFLIAAMVLSGLIISTTAHALDYVVYKLAFAAGTNLDSAVVDYVLTDPEKDSTITTLHVGDRTTIEAGERVYLADADTFTLTDIGGSSAGALVLRAPGSVIKDSPLSPLRIRGSKNNPTQILGPGPKYGTIGIVVSNEAEIENTLLAGHGISVGLAHQKGNIRFQANNFYVTNSRLGLIDLVGEIANNDVVQLDIQNAVFWKNSDYDVQFYNLTKGHIILRAKNSAFLRTMRQNPSAVGKNCPIS